MEKMNRRNFIKANLGTATALPLFSALPLSRQSDAKANTLSGRADAAKVGFSKVDISPCIKSKTGFRRPLEAVCASISSKEKQVIIFTLDLIEMTPQQCWSIQQEVGKGLSLAPERIVVHTTHTHSSPWGARESGQQILHLPETLIRCASEAISNARPARIRTGATDVGKTLSVYRRGDAGADLGVQTFWFGYTFRGNDGRPDASALVNEMKSRWLRKKPDYRPGPEPIWFDHDVDSLVQTISFEDAGGKPIGCIVRFSAHPHLSCACANWLYDPDYPGVVRDVVGKEIKAPVMFLSGACGNLVPKEKVKYVVDWDKVPQFPYMGPSSAFDPADDNELLAEMKRIGTDIAKAAIDGLKDSPIEDGASFKFASQPFAVPLDANLPADKKEVECIRKALVSEYESSLRQGEPLRELRGIANRLNWLEWAAPISMDVLTEQDRAAGEKKLPVSAVALNSNILIFMHSEISVETTFALRKQYPKLNIWTTGLTGGALGYFPTAKMIDEGGYEGRSTVIARDAEEKMRKDISKLLARLGIA